MHVGNDLHDLAEQFKRVQKSLIEVIERNNVPVEKLKNTLTYLPACIRERNKDLVKDGAKLMEAENVSSFMFSLNNYLDFLDPHLLEHMVTDHGDNETKQLMHKYNERLQTFRHNTKITDFLGIVDCGETLPGCKELEIAFGMGEWKDKTLQDLENLLARFPRQKWYLKRMRLESIVVVYSIPESEDLTDAVKQHREYLITQGVLWITVNGDYLIDLRQEQVSLDLVIIIIVIT